MSDPGSDTPRPRPQFGEYATPEQQRAHIREPAPEPPAPAITPRPPLGAPAAPMPTEPVRRPRQVDRLITLMLLGFGLVNVVLQLPRYLDMAGYAGELMKILGIPGSFTMTPAAQTWGLVAAVVYAVGYLLTALVSMRRLRSGKLTWWVPLVGAVVTSLAAGICVWVPLMSDPAFTAYFQQMAG